MSPPSTQPGRQPDRGRLRLNFYGTRHPPAETNRGPEVGSLAISEHRTLPGRRGRFVSPASWCEAGSSPPGQGLRCPTLRLSWGGPRSAPRAGGRARELHTRLRAGPGAGSGEDLRPSPGSASPAPRPDGAQRPWHSPRPAELNCAKRQEPEGARRRAGGCGHPAALIVPSRKSQREAPRSCRRLAFSAPRQGVETGVETADSCVRIPVSSAQLDHSALSPPFIRRPPLFGSGLLPRGAGESGAGSGAAPPRSHWRLWPPCLRALRPNPARACAPPRAAVYNARSQARPWPPLPLRELHGGTVRLPKPAGGGKAPRSDPWGSVPASAHGPVQPLRFPGSHASPACATPPLSPSAQPWQVTSLLDTRGHSRVPPGGSCQAQTAGAVPSSPFTSLATESGALPAPGTGHPSSKSTRSA